MVHYVYTIQIIMNGVLRICGQILSFPGRACGFTSLNCGWQQVNGWEGEFIQEKEINVPVADIVIGKRLSPMPRTKGSKNRPQTTHTDYAPQIAEKQETIASLTAEIASITANIDTLKADLKEKKTALKKAEKEVATLEAKKAKADAKAAEEAKKAEAEAVLKKLLASGMSTDEILEKLK